MATNRKASRGGLPSRLLGAAWAWLAAGAAAGVLAAIGAVVGVFVAAAGTAAADPTAVAAGFRVDNAVYADPGSEPISRSTTLFHRGVFYDFAGDQSEVVVFDASAGRLVLLSPRRRVRAELSTRQLADFTDQWRRWAEGHEDPFLRFAAAPRFATRHDPQNDELTLDSAWVSYRVRLVEPSNPATAEAYRTFCDAMARLGPMLDARARPPLPRLALDEEIARRGAVPSEVRLTLRSGRGRGAGGETSLRSTHRLVESLAAGDLERIGQVRGQIESFALVGLAEYRRAER